MKNLAGLIFHLKQCFSRRQQGRLDALLCNQLYFEGAPQNAEKDG